MATDLGELKYTLTLTDGGFTTGLNSAKEKMTGAAETAGKTGTQIDQVSESSKGLGGAFSSMAGQFVVGQALFTLGQKALDGLHNAVKDGIKSFQDWQLNQAQITHALQQTNDVSGQTVKGLDDYAHTLSDQTGITGNAINSAQEMLLKYTAIGKDVFPGATQATADLASSMSGGAVPSLDAMTGASKILGVALSDPEQSFGRLKKAGVVLTDQQKETIKSMQDAGNMAGAQKAVLDDLSASIGGKAVTASHTLAGEQAKLHAELEEVEIQVGRKLTDAFKAIEPYLARFASWVMEHKPVLAALGGVVAGLAIAIGVALVSALAAVVGPALLAVAALWPIIAIGAAIGVAAYLIYENWQKINKALQPVYEFFDKNIKPVLVEVGNIIKEQLIKAWDDLKKAFDTFMQAIRPVEPLLKMIAIAIGIALVAPIVLAVAAIVGLIAAVVAIGVFLARLFGWIAEAIAWFIKFEVGIYTAMGRAVEAVVSIGARVVQWFIDLPGRILGILSGAASWLWNTGINIVQGLVNGIVAMAGSLWNGVSAVSANIGRFFAGAAGWLWSTGRAIIQGLINGIDNMAGAVENKIRAVGNSITDTAKKILKIFSPSQVFNEEIGQQITAGLAQGIDQGGKVAVNATANLTQKVVNAGNSGLSNIQNPMASINNMTTQQPVSYNFGQGSVVLSTADAVNAFFNIGNRSTQLELMGGSPLAGTAGV